LSLKAISQASSIPAAACSRLVANPKKAGKGKYKEQRKGRVRGLAAAAVVKGVLKLGGWEAEREVVLEVALQVKAGVLAPQREAVVRELELLQVEKAAAAAAVGVGYWGRVPWWVVVSPLWVRPQSLPLLSGVE